jgi:hypothetical protein
MPTAAKAKSPPKSASALNAATSALESVGQLHARSKEATWELLMQVRRLHHMAAIFSEWAQDQNFYHPSANQDPDTNRRRSDHVDRLMFGIEEIADRAEDLDDAFQAAFSALRKAPQ